MTDVTYYGRSAAQLAEAASDEDEDLIDMRLPTPTTRYRETTIGKLLEESLQELSTENKLTTELCNKTLCQFDRSILNILGQRLTGRVMFKASKLHTYRFLDGVWTFVLDEVEFREFNSFVNVSKMKILAFDGKVPVPRPRTSSGKRRWRGSQNQQKPEAVTPK